MPGTETPDGLGGSGTALPGYFRARLASGVQVDGREGRGVGQRGRKHRIGKAHALHVMATVTPERVPATETQDARLAWAGPDDRGVELEVVALALPGVLLVIHVMPVYRR